MLTSNQIPALYNGISQQPATLRSATQAEEQVNAWATIVDGLQKRSPSEFVAKLTSALPTGAFLHDINRDMSERYIVVILPGDLKVFTLAGVELPVTFSSGKDYLAVPTGTSAKTNFAVATVADYTFVVNKSITVDLEAVGADEGPQDLDQWWLNPATEGEPAVARKVQYPPNPMSLGGYGIVQSFQKLPATAPDGQVYQITGTDESGFTTYYVRREGGVWNECLKPGLKNLVKATTMPHALVRVGPGLFEFGPFSWAPRRVGDAQTNPHPTFVGRQLRDVFFYKNRLGLCVDENTVLSRAGDFGVYHRMSVLDLLPDDTIDIAASETKVTKINFAVPFATSLMLFADQVQFRMNHQGIVSPGTMSLDVATQYQMSTKVRPAPLGSDVYFVSENGSWAALREYYIRDDTTLSDAADLTAHAPRYIPAGVTKLITSSDHDCVVMLTDGAPDRIYLYKFYWADENAKAQSSWSYWEMTPNDSILSGMVLDNYLYLVIARTDGTYLERIALDSGVNCPGLDFQVYLDRRVELTGTWLPAEAKTRFYLPYAVPLADRGRFRIVQGVGFVTARGALINTAGYEWENDTTVKVPLNFSAAPCHLGLSYEFRYTFSEQYIKTSQQIPVTTGRLQLRSFTVYYTNTAFFRTEVAPYGTDPDVETIVPAKLADFSGKTIGDASLVLGSPSFHEGSFTFQIYGHSDVAKVSITNDSHLACNFQSAEWEGFYQNRARFR